MTPALLQSVPSADIANHLGGIADGAMFVLQSALAHAAALATLLSLAPMAPRRAQAAAVLFVAAAVASVWMPPIVPAEVLAPAVLLVLGVVVAAGLRLRGWAAALAVAIGGVTAGAAGGLQTATWEEVVGGGMLLGLIVVTWLLLASRVVLPARIVRGATLARRMAGAWIAAVGILLVALWLRGVG